MIGPSGRLLASHITEINARALISTIEAIPRRAYKRRGRFIRLAYLAGAYQMLVGSDVRAMPPSSTNSTTT